MKITKFLAATAVGGLISTMPAYAQDVQDEEDFDDNVIIVTASKRETTLQETPISVSVTDAETIEQAQIRDLLDIQSVAPSLRVTQSQGSANTTFIIRGFGNGAQNIGIEPSVGVFIDGVFRSRSASQIGDLANVARVEILRGPQSTLFGKNASAGVISVITREPQFEFGGAIEASYGNYNAVVLKGDITGPLTETLAFSLDGSYNRRDGYANIVNLNQDSNNRNRWSARGQLLWEPSNNLTLRAIADYSSLNEDCCVAVNVVAGPTTPALFAVGGAVDVENPFSFNTFANRVPENQIDNYGISLQADYTTGPLSITSITSYRKLTSDSIQDVDFSSADIVDDASNQDVDTFTQELRLTSDFDGPFNFLLGGFYFNQDAEQASQLITGADTRTFFELLTPTGPGTFLGVETALGLAPNSIFTPGLLTDETFSFSNTSYSIFGTVDFEITDRLTVSGGFNYTDDKKNFALSATAFDPLANINLVDAVIIGQLVPFLGANAADPAAIAAFAAAPATAPIFAAIAAAATNPAVNPLLGLVPFQFQPPFLNTPNAVESGRTSDSDFSYTLRASYELSDNFNVYFTYATGFKASSINLSRDSRPVQGDFIPGPGGSTILAPPSPILDAGLAVPNLSTGTRFAGPEDAENYELGLKAKFDRFAFNVAVFDQTLRGFQVNAFTGTGFALTNAGERSTFGVEFDARVSPADPLVFTFALTYLDSVFDSFTGSTVGDLTGQNVAGVSEFSLATSATYTHEFNSGAELVGRIDYSHESNTPINNGLPTFNAALGNTQLFNREVNLVNGSLTLRLNNGLQVSLWGRNILDQTHLITVFDGVAQQGTVSGYPNQPRTYGASAKFKF